MKKYIKWILFSILLCIFLILSMLVLTNKDIYLDVVIYDFISKYINISITPYFILITHLASAIIVILLSILSFIILKNKKYGIYISLNLILITVFQLILKNLYSRNRPVSINLIDESGYSFPSGHSLTSMAFYGFIIYLIYISKLKKKYKITLIILLCFLILLIGISRIYLGVNYATDVLGGYTFSLVYLMIYVLIIKNKI